MAHWVVAEAEAAGVTVAESIVDDGSASSDGEVGNVHGDEMEAVAVVESGGDPG